MSDYKKWIKKRDGTSFRGYVLSTYEQLLLAFGKPTSSGDGYKIDVEWIIDTPHGVATIYNYKNGQAYMGESGLRLDQIFEWHVGGKNDKTYKWVKRKLQKKTMESMR